LNVKLVDASRNQKVKNAELQATQKKATMAYIKLLSGCFLNGLRRNTKASIGVVGLHTASLN
jgi:hypothetical protein